MTAFLLLFASKRKTSEDLMFLWLQIPCLFPTSSPFHSGPLLSRSLKKTRIVELGGNLFEPEMQAVSSLK